MPEGNLFSEYLLDMHTREIRKLKEGENQVETFRAQGAVGILDVLMRVKEDLRRYLKDVAEGRATSITEVPKEVTTNGMARLNKR